MKGVDEICIIWYKENYPLESQSLGKLHLLFTTIITSALQSVRKQRTESMKMKHIKKI